MKGTLLLLGLIVASTYAQAAPFDTCPSKAYLFQSTPVQIYDVNLVTGSTTLLEDDTGLASGINSVGFDFTDRYIYGYDTTNKKIVRLGKDFQAETLSVSGLPTDHTFYVGDVYKEFVEHSSGGYVARYPSKAASVPLDKGTANINFNVSDSQGRLVVEIWFYDGSAPIQKIITSDYSSCVM